MKLLLCEECSDIFNLALEEKSCSCGKAKGRYVDELNAVYSGGIPIGFANSTFIRAVVNQPKSGMGKEFVAFVIPADCPTFKKE